MDERLKVGVAGAGKMGALHLEKYLQIEDVEVVGFFEPSQARAEAIQAKLRVKAFDNPSALFFETDAVTIASPTASHYSLARMALEMGTHVLIEKPITQTVAEAEDLIRIAKEQALVLQVGFIERFRYHALVKNYPLSPVRFIETHRLSASLNREPSVDVVADLMIHDLDLVLSLVGEEPSNVSAIGVPVITDHCDLANVRLEFPSGAVANLNASRVSAKPFRKLRIFSTEAYASLDFIGNTVEVSYKIGNQIERKSTEPMAMDSLLDQCRHFAARARDGRSPLVRGEDGALALRYAGIVAAKIAERAAWRPKAPSFPTKSHTIV